MDETNLRAAYGFERSACNGMASTTAPSLITQMALIQRHCKWATYTPYARRQCHTMAETQLGVISLKEHERHLQQQDSLPWAPNLCCHDFVMNYPKWATMLAHQGVKLVPFEDPKACSPRVAGSPLHFVNTIWKAQLIHHLVPVETICLGIRDLTPPQVVRSGACMVDCKVYIMHSVYQREHAPNDGILFEHFVCYFV